MWLLSRKAKESAVRFCERCAQVCDDTCRRAALRDRVLLQQMWRGMA
jgi:hypothetical protein